MGTTVLIDGDTATVEPDVADVTSVARQLVAAAGDDTSVVKTTSTRKGVGFVVPADLVDGLDFTSRDVTAAEGDRVTLPPDAALTSDGGEFGNPIDVRDGEVPAGAYADELRARGLADQPTFATGQPAAASSDVKAPAGNAGRDVWAAFLEGQGITVDADASRDDLRDLWKARA